MKKFFAVLALSILSALSMSGYAATVGEVSTTWRMMGNDKIVVEAIKDDEVSGVVCHISYAKTGGVSGNLGFADDPSRFSIACRQNGPLVSKTPIPKQSEIAGFKRSAIFKEMKVVRMMDTDNNVMVYLIYATKLIDGSPFNSISSVPLMPWGTIEPKITVK